MPTTKNLAIANKSHVVDNAQLLHCTVAQELSLKSIDARLTDVNVFVSASLHLQDNSCGLAKTDYTLCIYYMPRRSASSTLVLFALGFSSKKQVYYML